MRVDFTHQRPCSAVTLHCARQVRREGVNTIVLSSPLLPVVVIGPVIMPVPSDKMLVCRCICGRISSPRWSGVAMIVTTYGGDGRTVGLRDIWEGTEGWQTTVLAKFEGFVIRSSIYKALQGHWKLWIADKHFNRERGRQSEKTSCEEWKLRSGRGDE